MLVPIGGWCRTAYQVIEFLKTKSIQPCAYPFDWTVTSFIALIKDLKSMLKSCCL